MNISIVIVAGLGVVCAALIAVAAWFRAGRQADLGSVSGTWIAELRAGDPYDSGR